ncbi:hypothetical protein, partial [Pectobacterium versatile]|uniref:hypothetical protein n=1 Tax=Pectobacterium versatile TaxID=2488639 RepID=UPI00197F1E6D
TYLSKLIDIPSLAVFLKLELLRVYKSNYLKHRNSISSHHHHLTPYFIYSIKTIKPQKKHIPNTKTLTKAPYDKLPMINTDKNKTQ